MNNRNEKKILLAFVVFLFCGACQDDLTGNQSGPEPELTLFERGLFNADIYPMANSTAYLSSYRDVYFINGEKVEKVVGLPESYFGKLVGLPDGSAIYSTGMANSPGLFRLEGVNATRIYEGNADKAIVGAASDADFYFIQFQRLSQGLAEARRSEEVMQSGDRELPFER